MRVQKKVQAREFVMSKQQTQTPRRAPSLTPTENQRCGQRGGARR